MQQIKTREMIKTHGIQRMSNKGTQKGKEDESSPTWTSTSSCDAARLVAFAVAESALLDTEADEGYPFHSFASSYSKNHGGDEERIVNLNTPPQIPTHTFPPSPFETPPHVPPSQLDSESRKSQAEKAGKGKNLRPDAPVFSPPPAAPQTRPSHTRTAIQHTRTRSDLLPAIALSTQAHRRISSISTSSPISSSHHQRTFSSSEAVAEKGNVKGKGDLPFPRVGARRSRAGMPTLAEITAYYATRPNATSASTVLRTSGATNSSRTKPNTTSTTQSTTTLSSTQSNTTTPFAHPRTRTFPAGESMQKRCSLSSNSSGSSGGSGSGWSSADSEGPRTPPADTGSSHHHHHISSDANRPMDRVSGGWKTVGADGSAGDRRESASRLPTFLRAASPDSIPSSAPENGKPTERSPYNALAAALARHRRTVSSSSQVQSRTVPDGRTQTPPPAEKRWMVEPPRRASSLDAAAHMWAAPTPERRRTEETPGIQVTPPSSTIPHAPAFSRRPTAPTRQSHIPSATNTPAEAANAKPATEHLTTNIPVPNLRLTPPTAIGGQGVSPLRRLEAEVAQQARATVSEATSAMRESRADVSQDVEGARKREQQAERMLRILGKRTGVVATGPGRG